MTGILESYKTAPYRARLNNAQTTFKDTEL